MPLVNPYPFTRDFIDAKSLADGSDEAIVLDEYWTQLPGVIVGLGLELDDYTKWATCKMFLYVNGQRMGRDYGMVDKMITPTADITPVAHHIPSGARIQVKGTNASGGAVTFKARVRVEEAMRAVPTPAAKGGAR